MGRKIQRTKPDKRTVARKKADFLAAFADCGVLSQAAKVAKVNRRVHYEWLEDPVYAEQFDQLGVRVLGFLEEEAYRRAVIGVDEPVYQQGRKVGAVKKYSDTLMVVLLKARAPEKYKDRVQQEMVGKGGKDLNLGLTDADLDARVKEIEAKLTKEPKPKKGRK